MSDRPAPEHTGRCVRSLDGDGEPLGYCVTCYQDMGRATCDSCSHPVSHHEAGECWTRADGTETCGSHDQDCACSWLRWDRL